GGPALTESYDPERRPASARAAEVSLSNYRRLIEGTRHAQILAPTPAGDVARREIGQRLVQENMKTWQPTRVHLGYIYHPPPIVLPHRTPQPAGHTIGHVPATCPRARAPHCWLEPGRSTLDLFGDGFVLLVFSDVATGPLEQAAAAVGLPLTVRRIASPSAAALYGRRLVLVRPDGHVAWRSDALPENATGLIDTIRGAGPHIAARRARRSPQPRQAEMASAGDPPASRCVGVE